MYYVLLIDFAVFNNRISAYVLVCRKMATEVSLFITALIFVILMFSSSFSCLVHADVHFAGLGSSSLSLWEMLMGLYGNADFVKLHNNSFLLIGCFIFLVLASIFLTNMLVAQLSCAYDGVYADMVGYARLKR